MKPIILRQHEITHLRDHGSVIAWRVVKPQPDHVENLYTGQWPCVWQDKPAGNATLKYLPSAYGRTREERWVKEAWNCTPLSQMAPGEAIGKSLADCIRDNDGFAVPAFDGGVVYKVDGCLNHPTFGKALWRTSTHMPRWASRFTVTLDVGVKRIQEITEYEAVESGSQTPVGNWNPRLQACFTELDAIKQIMCRTNPGSWDRNDYFWKITCTLKK